MTFYEDNSWKKKIDPAFDDLIRIFLDYIKHIRICIHVEDERYKKYTRYKKYLSLDEESLKVLKRRGYPPLLREFKLNRRNLRNLMNCTIAIGASPDSMLILELHSNVEKIFKNEKKKKSKKESKRKYVKKYLDAIESNIMDMINGLPREDSRDYYKKHFMIDLSDEDADTLFYGKTEKEVIKYLVDREMDISCLMLQTGFRGYWDPPGEDYNDKRISKLKLINMGMLQVYNAISITTYKKPLGVLYAEARNNDESLCNAIHLDKTLIDKDWVRKRIKKAFYSGESGFLKELGRAIGKAPISVKANYGELIIILVSLWHFGLYRLDNNELMDLLKKSSVPMQNDIEPFIRYINRLKKDNVLIDINKLIAIEMDSDA